MRTMALGLAALGLLLASPAWAEQGKARPDAPRVEQRDWDAFFGPDPFERFEAFEREYQAFRQAMRRLFERAGHDLGGMDVRVPELKLSETKNAYLVTMDLGDIDPKSLKIEVTDRLVTISGAREAETVEMDAKGNVVSRSVRTVQFSRAISLPGPVDLDRMSSKVEDGVLTVRLPHAR